MTPVWLDNIDWIIFLLLLPARTAFHFRNRRGLLRWLRMIFPSYWMLADDWIKTHVILSRHPIVMNQKPRCNFTISSFRLAFGSTHSTMGRPSSNRIWMWQIDCVSTSQLLTNNFFFLEKCLVNIQNPLSQRVEWLSRMFCICIVVSVLTITAQAQNPLVIVANHLWVICWTVGQQRDSGSFPFSPFII